MAKDNEKNIVSVLAFEKKLVPSDGRMYGTLWDSKDKVESLKLIEKSVRGTISNRLKPAVEGDPMKLNKEVKKPNLQKVDICSLNESQDTLKLHFTLKILGGIKNPSACDNPSFNDSYKETVNGYIEREKFTELARRYAINLANGRFLWRNRVGAEEILVKIEVLNKDQEQSWEFDAKKINIHDFEISSNEIDSLAEKIATALSSKEDFLLLDVTAYAKVGLAQEVYPSEELLLDKGKGKNEKSKILYKIDNVAAMHSQKIGNAIRTIDTWYPNFTEHKNPIAIEPYGAVTNLGHAFRGPKETKKDFYTFLDDLIQKNKFPEDINDQHYFMAVLVRGGVFGESSKES